MTDRQAPSTLSDLEGIPAALKIAHFAAALNMSERTVRGWVDAGRLDTLPTPPNCVRYIPSSELARLEADGWPVDWEKLLDFT